VPIWRNQMFDKSSKKWSLLLSKKDPVLLSNLWICITSGPKAGLNREFLLTKWKFFTDKSSNENYLYQMVSLSVFLCDYCYHLLDHVVTLHSIIICITNHHHLFLQRHSSRTLSCCCEDDLPVTLLAAPVCNANKANNITLLLMCVCVCKCVCVLTYIISTCWPW